MSCSNCVVGTIALSGGGIIIILLGGDVLGAHCWALALRRGRVVADVAVGGFLELGTGLAPLLGRRFGAVEVAEVGELLVVNLYPGKRFWAPKRSVQFHGLAMVGACEGRWVGVRVWKKIVGDERFKLAGGSDSQCFVEGVE